MKDIEEENSESLDRQDFSSRKNDFNKTSSKL